MTIQLETRPPLLAPVPDVAAFESQLRPLVHAAYDLAYAMLRDRQEAEDAVQEALVKAWRSFPGFVDRGGGIRPWFLTIVANQCRSLMRTRWWRSRPRATEPPEPAGEGHEDAAIRRLDLCRALERLTPGQRAALHLCYQLDLSQEEAARILRVRVGTIKSRLSRASRRLREAADGRHRDER